MKYLIGDWLFIKLLFKKLEMDFTHNAFCMTNRLISEKSPSWIWKPEFNFAHSILRRFAERQNGPTPISFSKTDRSPLWCCNYTLCANLFRAETGRMNQPRHRLAEPRRTPKKNVPCFSDLRATNFF